MESRVQVLGVVLCTILLGFVENRIVVMKDSFPQSTPKPETVANEIIPKAFNTCGAIFQLQLNETTFHCHTENIFIPGREEAAFCSNNSKVIFCEVDADCITYGNNLRCGRAICCLNVKDHFNPRLRIDVCTGAEYTTSRGGVSFVVIGLAVFCVIVSVSILGMILYGDTFSFTNIGKYFEGSSCFLRRRASSADLGLSGQALTDLASMKPLVVQTSERDLNGVDELPPPYDEVVLEDLHA